MIDKVKNALEKRKSFNKDVAQNLLKWQKLFEFSSSKEVLFQQLDEWCADEAEFKLKYNNFIPHTVLVVSVALAGLILYLGYDSWLRYLLVIPVGLMLYALLTLKSNRRSNQLLATSLGKVAELNYGFKFNQNYKVGDTECNRNFLMQLFAKQFNLGNYSNEIKQIATGSWDFDEQQLPYTIYHYHYVIKKVSTDSKGNQEVTYHKYNKWGIFIFNLPVSGVAIFPKKGLLFKSGTKYFPVDWSTSSIDFNHKFVLSGMEEIKLAKFFTPSMLMQIEKLYGLKHFSALNIIFANNYPVSHFWLDELDLFAQSYDTDSIKDIIALRKVLKSYKMANFEYIRANLEPFLAKIVN